MGSNHEPEQKGICSYCNLRLTKSYTFSYGIPGHKQVLGCERWWCKWRRRVSRKYEKTLLMKLVRVIRQTIKAHRGN